MRKLILFTVFLSLSLTPAFSQIKGHFKLDTTFKDRLSFSYQNPIRFGDSICFNFPPKSLLNNKRFSFPEYSGRNLVIQPDSIGSIVESQSYDRMPCYIPKGNYPMMVLKPDSTIKHTLLIKRYGYIGFGIDDNGFEEESIGCEIDSIGFEDGSIGFEDGSVGFEDDSIGFEDGSVLFEDENIGFEDDSVGL